MTPDELRQTLQQREDELALANDSLHRFVYAISHDIRSPVKTLNRLLEMLDDDHRRQLDEDGVELLDVIKSSGQRIQSMADGLSSYAEACRVVNRSEQVDTQAIVARILLSLQSRISATGATVDVGELPFITSSSQALEDIFSQLLDNALRHGAREPSAPRITVRCEQEAAGVHFVIEDQGPGIGSKDRERVFTVFERLVDRQDTEGVGLGLSICLKRVHNLHGRLWVESSDGQGAAFHLYLPSSQ